MEFFKNTNIDFLGKKWYFLGFSLIFSVAGLLSIFFWHGIPLGVDFKGGTLVYVQFTQKPDLDKVRGALDKAGMHNASIQSYGPPANNEVVVKLEQKETSEAALDQGRSAIQSALNSSFDPKSFTIRSVEIVGPQVGAQLRQQALLATLYSLLGMLVYLWFRFELIYGVAAVVAVFHDTLITLGAFSLLESGDIADGDRRHPDPDRLLDERHHRGLRPHSREPENAAPGMPLVGAREP